MNRHGTTTKFEILSHGVIVSGTVTHGGYLSGYGARSPEATLDRVLDEDAGTDTDFDTWLATQGEGEGRTPQAAETQRILIAKEIEEEAIASVLTRDDDPPDVQRADYEMDQHKDRALERDARKDSDR